MSTKPKGQIKLIAMKAKTQNAKAASKNAPATEKTAKVKTEKAATRTEKVNTTVQVETATSEMETGAVVKKNYVMVPPRSIVVDEKENFRIVYDEIEELSASIIVNGLRNPLKVYMKDGKPHLREGYRRMRAINLALKNGNEIALIPVILDEKPLNEDERTLEFLINNDGKPYTMVEQVLVVQRLLALQWKVTDIQKRTGKARGYIENLIMLATAPVSVQNYMLDDKISAHAVIQIMRAVKSDPEKTVIEVEAAIEAAKTAGKEKATPKYVNTKEVKAQAHGKFYKWCEAIADAMPGRDDRHTERCEVLEKMLIAYENGQSPAQFAETFFIDKTKKSAASDSGKKSGKK